MIRTLCVYPGCPNDGPRCALHNPRNGKRWGALNKFYSSAEWRAIRRRVLSRKSTCRCGKRATEVHHIESLADGGSSEFSNLEAMCKGCHVRATVTGVFGRL